MRIGVIGGSGLDDPDILEEPRDISATTAWGEPSSPGTAASIPSRRRRSITGPTSSP